MSDTVKYVLDESRMPRVWYNLQADLPKPLPPVLHPGTLKPIGPDDLAPLFPMELIRQRVGAARHRHRKPNAALNLALTRNVLLALIPFEEGEPLAHFFERYHRHPSHALRLILNARPVL